MLKSKRNAASTGDSGLKLWTSRGLLSARLRWVAFALYLTFFFTVPLALLFDESGALLGLAFALSFLWWLRFHGLERITARMGARRTAAAEVPELSGMVDEYCRRLSMPRPRLAVLETAALNLAIFGFSSRQTCLVVTRGALNGLSREELGALVGRELGRLWSGELSNQAWLSQFLSVVNSIVGPLREETGQASRSFYSFKLFLRQILLYPLSLVPLKLLRGSRRPGDFDLKSLKITRNPRALSGALRRIEAQRERLPFATAFDCRHLFCLPPPTLDPLARVFFGEAGLAERIREVEALTLEVRLTRDALSPA